MFSDVHTGIQKRENKNLGNTELIRVKPLVNVLETENSVILLAEMPGVRKSDLNVKVENGLLKIEGRKVNREEQGNYIYRETHDIQYHRTFELEKNLDLQKIEASYNLGILKVVIAKKEIAKPRVIEIG
ncbi:MAG: Hsp20/alpha crystallin family protein [Calditrichota bacterium]|jgi:HSP20 family protein